MNVRLVIASLLLCAVSASPALAQHGPTKVVTATAEVKTLPVSLTLVGSVEPKRRAVVGTEVAGLVAEMPAREGDVLLAGDVIGRLNTDVLRLQLEREQARLASRQAQLSELENGTRQEVLARLRADLDAAKAVAQRWAFELKRVERLQGGEYANEKEYQDALSEQQASEAQRVAAQAQYEEGVAGPRKEVIAAARAALAEQQAQVALIEMEIRKSEIRAPFNGFVAMRHAEVGNWLGLGASVVELVELETVLVRVNAPESAMAHVHPDDRATVYVDAVDQAFEGRVRHIIPQANASARTFPIEIEIANPDHVLKAGMFARSVIAAGPEQDTVAVPKDAVTRQQGASFVALIAPAPDGSTLAVPTPVTVGLEIDDWVAITSSNLPAGAQVVVRGNEMITLMRAPAPVVVAGPGASAAPSTPASEPSKTPADQSEHQDAKNQ